MLGKPVVWDWLGAEDASLRLAGHSHRIAFRDSMPLLADELQRRAATLDLRGRTVPAPGAFYPSPDKNYWRLAARAGTTTAIVWDGNQHNVRFLLSDAPFTVVGRREPAQPPEGRVLPFRMMRALFEGDLETSGLTRFLAAHADPASVVVIGTPPPKSEQQVREGLAYDERFGQEFFVNALAELGFTPESVPVTSDETRVACWEALQEAMAQAAAKAGATFLPVPDWLRNGEGTLRPEYCEPDTTHANTAYGVAMWQQIAERVEGD